MGFKLCDLFYQHIVELERASLAQYHQPSTRQLRGGSRPRAPSQARSDADARSRGIHAHGAAASQQRIALWLPAGSTCRLPHVSFWHRSHGTPRVALRPRPGLPVADP